MGCILKSIRDWGFLRAKDIHDNLPTENVYGNLPTEDIHDNLPTENVYGNLPAEDIYDNLPTENIYDNLPTGNIYGNLSPLREPFGEGVYTQSTKDYGIFFQPGIPRKYQWQLASSSGIFWRLGIEQCFCRFRSCMEHDVMQSSARCCRCLSEKMLPQFICVAI
ncbi:MAG: hypothetical protein LBG13_03575 [Holosporales bacterium]|jgi:hypothetical protein|nr:hypothetical protein [Holosporales bacterium]